MGEPSIFKLMGSDVCVNVSCGSATSHEWKMGWPLRSGGFAQFCNNCGISKECKLGTPDFISTFENSVFCDKFHREETGWRDCSFCNKPIHCGCIVSKSLFDYLDFGGIGCVSCIRASQYRLMQNAKIPNGAVTSTINDANDRHIAHIDGRPSVDSVDEGKLMQLCRVVDASETSHWHQPQRDEIISPNGPNSQEVKCPIREVDSGFSNLTTTSIQPITFPMLENTRPTWEIKNMHEPTAQPSLSMSLGTPSGNPVLPSARESVEERLEGKQSPPFHHGQRSRPILPKPSKTGIIMNVETNKGMNFQARIARPPADGRGKNQLLPRYWPRITDQELEQLSGNLKSNVVPLFEKVLSASDAGRIGRLVLPKACAEAYFPPISQSEGLPLRMQDVKGNEWTFQFRFWPNNNSRMYVLEGVTPCIQAMQLCAGDTVTFSRIDPGGKLVMGFRKASNSVETQDVSTHSNGVSKEATFSGANENLPAGSSYSDLLHSMEGNREPHSNGQSEHLHLDSRVSDLPKTENCGEMTNNNSLQQSISGSEKKRTRNIGPKNKRLLIHCEDALELRLTWEEAQDLLRPPPSVQPSIVTIEDHVFEEYNEPPVFGKRTIFSTCPSGLDSMELESYDLASIGLPRGQEQWAPCDDCSKWRRLPADVLLPPKWTCSENVWDASRSSCSAPEELSSKELENLLKTSKGYLQDSKKRRVTENNKSPQELEPSGLDALASAAALGDNLVDPCDSSGSAATTKHPRHRPGCTCIVCIQPPSGKGKHHSTCTCNVCMTVKRRFKTLMLRKKQRRSEREADATQMDQRDESDMNGVPTEDTSHLEKSGSINKRQLEVGESSAGQIDLNCHPDREDMEVDVPEPSMNCQLEGPNYPLQEFMNQNGPAGGESQRYFSNGGNLASIVCERERRDNEEYYDPNSNQKKTQNNHTE
ncbi:B3 domain-containing transcription repressor VAL1 isoform X1 [Senna tora]|uniref:B3 domain-containing transcription repressor VAL1 isoform X1 n=1 Tax=Senna tora TaxID=362788 RepID=A0A834TFB5_9FABA|nr:B3 domain-containing transcription repressor VAL1 isoform X1 [Senna tora]